MFTDVSSIPASAVERIEILPEGAAALYGSDAIGGVVNIIVDATLDGASDRELHRPLSGSRLRVGYHVEGGQGLLAYNQINFGIINFLDQRPHFVNYVGYDAANATVLGRQVSLQVVKSWGQ